MATETAFDLKFTSREVTAWSGLARFAHADITRLDPSLARLVDWGQAAGHKAIARLFRRFDQPSATRVQSNSYRWLFDKLQLNPITRESTPPS